MAACSEIVEDLSRPLSADGVEVDQHIIKDHRESDASAGEIRNECETYTEEQLFASAAAEHIDGERLSGSIFNEQDIIGQWSPDPLVLAAGELVHKTRSDRERLGLAVLLVLGTNALQNTIDRRVFPPSLACVGQLFLDLA